LFLRHSNDATRDLCSGYQKCRETLIDACGYLGRANGLAGRQVNGH
jgi:hypothetical protein